VVNVLSALTSKGIAYRTSVKYSESTTFTKGEKAHNESDLRALRGARNMDT